MTFDALRTDRTVKMVVMGRDVKYLGCVAAGTQLIPLRVGAAAVGIVTVAADDSGLMHSAL